jgi:hypothetical protein
MSASRRIPRKPESHSIISSHILTRCFGPEVEIERIQSGLGYNRRFEFPTRSCACIMSIRSLIAKETLYDLRLQASPARTVGTSQCRRRQSPIWRHCSHTVHACWMMRIRFCPPWLPSWPTPGSSQTSCSSPDQPTLISFAPPQSLPPVSEQIARFSSLPSQKSSHVEQYSRSCGSFCRFAWLLSLPLFA